jgi:mycothiol synthase
VTSRFCRRRSLSSQADLLRAPTVGDADAIAALYADLRATDSEEVRSWFRNPTFDIERDFRVVERKGAVVGYVDVHLEGDRLSVDWAAGDPVTSNALLDWADGRAREERVARVRSWVWQPTGPEAGVLRDRGFGPVRTSLEMQTELRAPPPESVWPDGVAVRTVHEGEEPLVHELIEEAFADGNDFRPTPYEEWAGWVLDPKRVDRDFWFIAQAGQEAVAVAVCEPERIGEPGLGWVESLAVRRSWRRRGLGRALLLHAFCALHARGRTAAGLSVDAENPTGAVRLYESVGMRSVRTRVVYEKRLQSAAAV